MACCRFYALFMLFDVACSSPTINLLESPLFFSQSWVQTSVLNDVNARRNVLTDYSGFGSGLWTSGPITSPGDQWVAFDLGGFSRLARLEVFWSSSTVPPLYDWETCFAGPVTSAPEDENTQIDVSPAIWETAHSVNLSAAASTAALRVVDTVVTVPGSSSYDKATTDFTGTQHQSLLTRFLRLKINSVPTNPNTVTIGQIKIYAVDDLGGHTKWSNQADHDAFAYTYGYLNNTPSGVAHFCDSISHNNSGGVPPTTGVANYPLVAQFGCSTGASANNSEPGTCKADGSCTTGCENVSVGASPTNGTYDASCTSGADLPHGGQCGLTCAAGYHVSGSTLPSCHYGTFSSRTDVTCEEVVCSPIVLGPGVVNATATGCFDGTSLSAVSNPTCEVACAEGHYPQTGALVCPTSFQESGLPPSGMITCVVVSPTPSSSSSTSQTASPTSSASSSASQTASQSETASMTGTASPSASQTASSSSSATVSASITASSSETTSMSASNSASRSASTTASSTSSSSATPSASSSETTSVSPSNSASRSASITSSVSAGGGGRGDGGGDSKRTGAWVYFVIGGGSGSVLIASALLCYKKRAREQSKDLPTSKPAGIELGGAPVLPLAQPSATQAPNSSSAVQRGMPLDTVGDGVPDHVAVDTTGDGNVDRVLPIAPGASSVDTSAVAGLPTTQPPPPAEGGPRAASTQMRRNETKAE